MASSSSTDDLLVEALVASAKEKVEESRKKARFETKGSAVSEKVSLEEDAVSAGYIVVEAECPVSGDADKDEESAHEGQLATEAPMASSAARKDRPSGADATSMGAVVVAVPKKTSKRAKPMKPTEDLPSDADRDSASTREAVVAAPKKTSKRAKPVKTAEDLPSNTECDSAALGEAVVEVPKKTSKRAKPVRVAEDGSEAPAPTVAKAISRKSRRASDTGEDDVSPDVQEPASKKSKAANGEGKAGKKPKILHLDANGEIVEDRVTPLVNKKGVRDSGKASHPDMKMSPGYIKALELKMHKEVSDAGHRAKASGRRTWKDIDA